MATKKEIRSKYIRNLVEDAASTSEKIEDATKNAVEQLLESTINKSLRKLISEQAEDDTEKENDNAKEESNDTDFIEDNKEDDTQEEETTEDEVEATDDNGEDTVEVDSIEDTESETEEDAPAAEDGEEMESDWTDFEQFKDEDGEYDLTGQDDETVYKVLMAMDPEKDGIRLVKNGEGKFTLTDDNTDKEYIIDLECEDGTCDAEAEVAELDEDLGYTDNYQNQTAMTTPGNNEPSKFGRTWDKGIPTGTEKPWVGNGAKQKGHPYDDTVNECGPECGMDECDKLYELEMDVDTDDTEMEMDEMTTIANGSRVKGTKGDTNHSEEDRQRHIHKSYDRVMNESRIANLNRKASAIIAENKELKGFATKIAEKLRESAVINASLAKVVRLMTENSTSKEEKDNIVNRFSKVETLEECNKLYETISEELKSRKSTGGSKIPTDKPLTESKNNGAKETKMLDESEAKDVIDFMKRLNKVK
jgi:hypothetical protein